MVNYEKKTELTKHQQVSLAERNQDELNGKL